MPTALERLAEIEGAETAPQLTALERLAEIEGTEAAGTAQTRPSVPPPELQPQPADITGVDPSFAFADRSPLTLQGATGLIPEGSAQFAIERQREALSTLARLFRPIGASGGLDVSPESFEKQPSDPDASRLENTRALILNAARGLIELPVGLGTQALESPVESVGELATFIPRELANAVTALDLPQGGGYRSPRGDIEFAPREPRDPAEVSAAREQIFQSPEALGLAVLPFLKGGVQVARGKARPAGVLEAADEFRARAGELPLEREVIADTRPTVPIETPESVRQLQPVTKPIPKPVSDLPLSGGVGHPQFDLSFVDKIKSAKEGTIVGTVGDFIHGPKTRQALKESLDVPIMVLNRAIEKGKTITNEAGLQMAGAFGTYKGKPTIFVNSKSSDIPTTIIEEATHSIRDLRGRSGVGGGFKEMTQDIHDAIPGEISSAKFVDFIKNIKEDVGAKPPVTPVEATPRVAADLPDIRRKQGLPVQEPPPVEAKRAITKPTEPIKTPPVTAGAVRPGEGTRRPALPPKAIAEKPGDIIGLSKAEQNRIRETTGLSELEPVERKTWERTLSEAKEGKLDQTALETAAQVTKSKRPISDAEHAGMVLKAAELANEYDASIKTVSDLIKKGNVAEARLERSKSETILDQIDELTAATRAGRREIARSLSIGRMMVNRQDYSLAHVMQRARVAKGAKLSEKESAKIQQLTEKHSALEKKLKEVEAQNEKLVAEREQVQADKIASQTRKQVQARVKSEKAIKRLGQQRTKIKRDLAALGFRLNDITGVTAEGSFLIGKLAVNYIREGSKTLEQVVKQVRSDLPEITDRDVHRALIARNPRLQAKARTEVSKRVAQMKTQSRLLIDIEKAEKGIFDKPKGRAVQPQEIRSLQKTLRQLRLDAHKSGLDAGRLAKTTKKIDEIQDQLANFHRPLRKAKNIDPQELATAKEKLTDLRKLMRTQDELARLNERLRTGELKVSKKLLPKKISPELKRAQIELKKARTDVSKRVAQLKTRNRLLLEIENAEKGIFKKRIERPVQPFEIRRLQRTLTKLRSEAYRSGLDATRLEKAIQKINDLQDQLANQFRPVRKRKLVETPELASAKGKIREIQQLMRTTDELARLREQLRNNQFEVSKKLLPKKISPEMERAQIDLKIARKEVQGAISDMAPLTFKKGAVELADTFRTLKATLDVSGTLRQGFISTVSHPFLAAKTFPKSVQAIFSKFTSEQIDNAIRSVPHHYIREKSGLYLSPVGAGKIKLSTREEAFRGQMIQRVPIIGHLVKGSERHMLTYLNLIRSEVFDQFLAKNPNATHAELSAMASIINVTTGRGNLGRASAIGSELGFLAFAPRFAVSRIQTPWYYAKGLKLPRVRREVIRDMTSVATTGATILGLAEMAGFEVGDDPRESDFGKIRVGNTRIDIWAGYQQPMRLLWRVGLSGTDRVGFTGKQLSEFEKRADPVELFGRFARYKIAPSINIPIELLTGRTVVGEPTTPSEAAVRALFPIVVEDIREAFQDAGFSRVKLVAPLAALGVGTNTFTDSESRVRRDIKRALRDGNYGAAKAKQWEWNIENPGRQITDNIFAPPDTTK